MSEFSSHYPPNPYNERSDINGDEVIDIVDFSYIAMHYNHQSPYLPPTVAGNEVESDVEVRLVFTEESGSSDPTLYVDVVLENVTPFSMMVVSLRNEHPDLSLRDWTADSDYPSTVLFTPTTRNEMKELFYGVVGHPQANGTILVGQLAFDINNGAQLEIHENDFALMHGKVLNVEGQMASFKGTRANTSSPIDLQYRNQLAQNYPNPFNPSTAIEYSLAKDSDVELRIYDAQGRSVRTLVEGFRQRRNYRVVWDALNDNGNQVSSGVYFYKLETKDFRSTKKMVLIR